MAKKRISHKKTKKGRWPYRLRRHLLAKMLSGLLIVIPFFIAYFVLVIVFRMILSIISPILRLGLYSGMPESIVTILSVIILVFIVYLFGVLATYSFGKKMVALTETLLLKIPLLKTVFSASKTAISALSVQKEASFHSVVFIEFPKEGYWTFGFVTGVTSDINGQKYYKIFMPTTPNPTTGFFMIVNQKDVIQTDISVEDALQSLLTGGILFSGRLPVSSPSSDSAMTSARKDNKDNA
jgi:uncharacterized membrane protein